MHKLFSLSFILSLGATFASAQIGCLATTSSVVGSYTFTASEVPFAGVGFVPPGTNPQIQSNTTLGKLIGNINIGATFSSAGVFYFDGAGNISVAAASSPLGAAANVGTYSVNSDCTINVKLTDVFNTATSGAGVTIPTLATTSLIGIVLGGGTEIDLTAAQSTTSKNGNTPLVTGEFASRLNIQLIRSFPYGCSVSSLNGPYGLIGSGFVLVNTTGTGSSITGSVQPVTFFASISFDGNGNVIAQTPSSISPLGSFQYSGSYTVNLDCSGTMMLLAPATGTTTASTPTITASFVLIPPVAYVANGTATLTGSADRPSMLFNISTSIEQLSGYGRAQ
jgi:hypothetical protein